MAGYPRASAFMPTIKCSTCAADVEISMMGEHICEEEPPMPEPMNSRDYFSQYNNIPYGRAAPPTDKYSRVPPPADKYSRGLPPVDTSAANRGFVRPGQLTPNSSSSDSRSVSPRTPGGRSASRGDDYFSPSIASDYGQSPPSQGGRTGGYNGVGIQSSYVDDMGRYAESPKKASFMGRMDGVGRAPTDTRANKPPIDRSGFPSRNNSGDDRYGVMDRPGTSMSQASTGSSSGVPPRAARKNGYGGFGPPPGREPERQQEDFQPQAFGRSGTFPNQNLSQDAPPVRTPSAPGSRADHRRMPSMVPDTSRKPPPRTSVTVKSSRVPSVNLANEFGIGNPYHNPAGSVNTTSMYSVSSGRPSNQSGRSNMTSPSSVDSFQQQQAPPPLPTAGADLFDSLMTDLQSSMDQTQSREVTPNYSDSSADPVANDGGRDDRYGFDRGNDGYGGLQDTRGPSRDDFSTGRSGSRNKYGRPPPSRGNDYGRRESPLPSPTLSIPTGQGDRNGGRTRASPLPSPTLDPGMSKSDQWLQTQERERGTSERRGRDREIYTEEHSRDRYASEPRNRYDGFRRTKPTSSQPPPSNRTRTPSARRPDTNRGICRACGEPIRGKSISSADGRLSGKYHKACFVCTTCKEPFAGTTFYVHSDKPYCEQHYHEVNGSLCGTCKRGIEGEYLADEEGTKYHPDCFRCADCGSQLRDGYFEVDGVAYCERDAWRRVQPPAPEMEPQQVYVEPPRQQQQQQSRSARSAGLGGLSAGPKVGRAGVGLPQQPGAGRKMNMGGNMLAPPLPRLNKRMTRLGIM